MTPDEILKVETYMKKLFGCPALQVRKRPQKDDSAEVYIGDEFIGIMFRDDDDEDEGETAYQFQMAILDFDLE
ncbi:MAG: DUF3126 family protein [Methyloceanibacter sp.]